MRYCERIIVTGGAGFIGRCFIKLQLEEHPEREVINFDNLTYAGNLKNTEEFVSNSNYHFIKGDICNPDHLSRLVQKGDFIVNFAAESHVDNSLKDANPFFKTNVLGTRNLLEIARNNEAGLFLQISTDEVYGSLSKLDRPSFENDKQRPTSPYSVSKSQAEAVCKEFMPNLPILITRSSNNLGPFQHPEKFIPRAITHAIQRRPIPIYGNGENIRDWVYVSDNCKAIDFVISKGIQGETYNIGGGNQVRNIDIARKILSYLNLSDELIEFVGDRKNHDFRYDLNHSKLLSLGFEDQKEDIFHNLGRTIDWYLRDKLWWEPLKKQAEEKYSRR